jgi:hypothetical protein
MEGILYLVDENSKKRFVQIDLQKYDEELLQDFLDGLVADSRMNEESISYEEVLNQLKITGKLDE